MRYFQNLSIRGKLMAMVMISCLAAVGLLVLAFVSFEWMTTRQMLAERLLGEARVIGAESQSSLILKDPDAAGEILKGLKFRSEILAACLYDESGKILFSYNRAGSGDFKFPMVSPEGPDFSRGKLHLFEPVYYEHRLIGTVYIVQDISGMQPRFYSYMGIGSGVLMISILVALLLSSVLGRVVSRPILELAVTTRRITDKKDYATLATQFYPDEVGQLIDSFNQMLGEIDKKEKILREREQRFRALTENASDIIAILDAEGRILYGSPSFARLFSNKEEAFMGRSFFDFVHSSNVWRIERNLKSIQKAGDAVQRFDFQFKCEDGSWMVMGAIARNMLHVEGVNGIVVNARDITMRKQAEKELISHRDGLEQMVTARTKDLEASRKAALDSMQEANEQRQRAEDALKELTRSQVSLAKAKDAAEAANHAKSNFLANMSHEIRTPMNAVIGLADLALKSDSEEKKKDYLNKILRASNSLLGIINDILDFTKIEQRKIQLESTTFDLYNELRTVTELFALSFEEKGLSLLVDFSPDIPSSVVGDPLRLRQILINLISNALKFTKEGQITLSGRTVERGNDRIILEFSVSDTGIGMDEELTRRVFDTFKQGDESTTRIFGGTGLGLSISKHLVELMGGEIRVESFFGKGSTFTFTACLEEAASHSLPEPPLGLEGLRVLVVDDDEEVRLSLTHMLKDLSFRPGTAASVDQAIKMLGLAPFGDPFRLVILDWQLPGKKGTEAIKIISERESIPIKPRVMVMSGFWNDQLQRELEENEVQHFLAKPFKVSSLLDSILRVFSDEVRELVRSVKEGDKDTVPMLKHAHLLLAEDNELNQEVALGLLEETGCKVTVVENGKAVIDVVRRDSFDLILMDIQMPEMDGYETTRCIREMESRGEIQYRKSGIPQPARLPIIAMTAGILSRDRHRAHEAGMDDHVPKPVDPRLFFQALSKWIPCDAAPEKSHAPGPEPLDGMGPFPGIDLAVGLAHMRGNKERLMKLMKKFARDQATVADNIRKYLEEGDRKSAYRIAHTLKGLAGTVGATRLQEAARQLEGALKKEADESSEGLLVKMEESLKEVVEGLAGLETEGPSPDDPAPEGAVLSDEEAPALIDRLSNLLKDGDSEAFTCFTRLEKAGILPGNNEETHRLKSLIDAYAFEEALEVLEKLVFGQPFEGKTRHDK